MQIKCRNSNLFYKSKTDDLFAEIKSFIFNQAKVKYIKKPKPRAKKLL